MTKTILKFEKNIVLYSFIQIIIIIEQYLMSTVLFVLKNRWH